MRIDTERARAFVLAHGSLRDQARLDGILGRVGADRQVVKELEGLQNPDGGFPAGLGRTGPGPSSVDATCYVLHQLKDLPPLAGSPMASRAVAYLRRVQAPEGFWVETTEAADEAGSWARTDNPLAAAYLTANAAFTVLMADPLHLDPVGRGAAWLRKSLANADAPTQTLGLAWALFYRMFGHDSQEAGWCFATAYGRGPEAYELAWLLACGLEAAVGGAYVVPIYRGLERLAAMQQEDGSWPAEPGLAVESTLTALRVLRGYGLLKEE